ncbi:MAG: AtpZ/AtpI family protein [Bacteroidota bacterium]
MDQQNQPNLFFKYSSLVIQMGVIIGLFAWGGHKLDAHFQNRKPILTIILSLSGIAIGLYLVLRDFIKPKDPSK